MDLTPETVEAVKTIASIIATAVSTLGGATYLVWRRIRWRMRGKAVHADLAMNPEGKLQHFKFEIEESAHPAAPLNPVSR
jgi:hypothetical protein